MLIPLIARFTLFHDALAAEMREAIKLGVAQEKKMTERKQITEEEELKLWELNLLGKSTAKVWVFCIIYRIQIAQLVFCISYTEY